MEVFDLTGRRIMVTQSMVDDRIKMEMANPPPGIYIVKAFISGKLVTRKVMVHP